MHSIIAMLFPLTTTMPMSFFVEGVTCSTLWSRTMFMNWSYPRRTPLTVLFAFNLTAQGRDGLIHRQKTASSAPVGVGVKPMQQGGRPREKRHGGRILLVLALPQCCLSGAMLLAESAAVNEDALCSCA